jgi:carbamate kinase
MRILVALGGNALLRRGETLSAAAQQAAIATAAGVLADAVLAGHHLIITHGNGPQVGLLALQSAAGPVESALPLDVLGAESEGWIGYAIELALRNALTEGAIVVTLVTQTLVDAQDEAFAAPSKPIGPVYDEATARRLAEAYSWTVAPDGKFWRRVVASPKPQDIIELAAIQRLIEHGAIVICAGGGGIPVCAGDNGKLKGVEAVIDKDATSALLAEKLGVDFLVLLSDVAGVYLDFATATQRLIANAGVAALELRRASFAAGSMGPKVAAACDFVHATGNPAAIGALGDLMEILAVQRGTVILGEGTEIRFHDPVGTQA